MEKFAIKKLNWFIFLDKTDFTSNVNYHVLCFWSGDGVLTWSIVAATLSHKLPHLLLSTVEEGRLWLQSNRYLLWVWGMC